MDKPYWSKIDKQFVHTPSIQGLAGVQLVARATGWQVKARGEPPAFAGAVVNVAPVAILWQDGNQETSMPLGDPTRAGLWGIMGAALLVSLVCWVTTAVATWLLAPAQPAR